MKRLEKFTNAAQKGFTLIELMIVVAVVGILAAIAMPTYQSYTAKAQISEAQVIAEGVKRDVELLFATEGICPLNDTNGIAPAASITGKYIASVTTNGAPVPTGGCRVMAQFRATGVSQVVANRQVAWTLLAGANTSEWNCTSNLGLALIPRGCTFAATP